MNGYQSDTINHTEANAYGWAVASGSANTYTAGIEPDLLGYQPGTILKMKFATANTGASTISINALTARNIQKLEGGSLVNLKGGELQPNALYLLVYDGSVFQVINLPNAAPDAATESLAGIAELATQAEVNAGTDTLRIVTPATLQAKLDNLGNRTTTHTVDAATQLHPDLSMPTGRNKFVTINDNQVITGRIIVKPNAPVPLNFPLTHILNLPRMHPDSPDQLITIASSNYGGRFTVTLSGNGKVVISGTFTNANEELIINLSPYIAELPLQFHGTQPPS